jgi:glycosyltransferase involved in cell wall biosynthesis
MTIAFVHPHKSFLQNPVAYADFFSSYGIGTVLCRPDDSRRKDADVEWHFMGTNQRKDNRGIIIHEYASSSIPPFSSLKNRLKKMLNIIPDYRLFNNSYVRDALHFSDGVPSGIREYGIVPPARIEAALPDKKYDFVYLGTVGPERRLESLFQSFASEKMKNRTLLVISRHFERIARRYQGNANIHFIGPVSYYEVRGQLQQCRYGINFMPDILPFNNQISAKLLDYAAAGLPVITTDYPWVRDFQTKYGGNFFKLAGDLSNFEWEEITRFPYQAPDLQEWSWENQIRKSGVLEFLMTRFDSIDFTRKIT